MSNRYLLLTATTEEEQRNTGEKQVPTDSFETRNAASRGLTPEKKYEKCECGRPTDAGRWRCDQCQADHDATSARMLEILKRNRDAVRRARDEMTGYHGARTG